MATKEETIKKVMEIWDLYPDWRLGQLLCNLAVWERGTKADEVWELTNEEIIKSVNSHLKKKD